MNFKAFILSALPSIALAGFTILAPAENVVIQAGGGVYTITWQTDKDSSYSHISIILKQGDTDILTIAESVQNKGSYLWNPSTSLAASKNYEIEIGGGSSSEMKDSQVSPPFEIELCSTCSAISTPLTPTTSESSNTVPGTTAIPTPTMVGVGETSLPRAPVPLPASNSSTTGSNITTPISILSPSNSSVTTPTSGAGKNAIVSGFLGGILGLFLAL